MPTGSTSWPTPSAAPVRGRAAVREAVAGMFALVPDLAFEFVSLRTGEEFWVVQWKLTGTTVTAAAVDVDLADFVVVDGGAVKKKHSYVDGVAMQAALASPEAAGAEAH
ncbi:nuclear transport factor 2 family protein [Streptomyces sp. NPDC007971]|uniref:nuclear transport factor 2 family protein n=1 Tax=Streptomyces sp. NPDC007971 TaxID=3364799 RepID=UPI0036E7D0B0